MKPRTNTAPTSAITVQYIYSACIKTITPDVTILHDPWFTEGIYDGSWYHFPKVNSPLDSVGDCDLIYVSHIHPDHYDSAFLRTYFARYGTKPLIIADHAPNHLLRKMRSDGFSPMVLTDPMARGTTTVTIIPHKTGSVSDIDSAIIIEYSDPDKKRHCVVNANDIIFDEEMRRRLKDSAGDVDILLCGYTGAGPYPQTYFDLQDPQLVMESEKKKHAFFERYKLLTSTINAKTNIPFAGKYVLGGPLAKMNAFRGVSDPVEVLAFDPNALVLADNGAWIDTRTFKATGLRKKPYDEVQIHDRLSEIDHLTMNYERLIPESEIPQLPLTRLLAIAASNARKKSECDEDYYFCFSLPNNQRAVVNANRSSNDAVRFVDPDTELPRPRSEIYIDPRYLFGLLTHIYHWNNAEVGSQYQTRRHPNELNRKAQAFLNYFTV